MRSRRFAVLTLALTAREPLSLGDPLRADVRDRMLRETDGDASEEVAVSLPVAQDPQGNAVVRGTSVFGALRNHLSGFELIPTRTLTLKSIDSRGSATRMTRAATLADLLCGSEPEELAANSNDRALRPSCLRLVQADLTQGRQAQGSTRTAISRRRGAAAAHKLFRRSEVDHAMIDVVVQIDLAFLEKELRGMAFGPAASAKTVIDDLVTAIHAWRPFLGGRVGTGFGEVTVGKVRRGSADPLPLVDLLTADNTLDLFRKIASQQAAPGPLTLCRDLFASRTAMWRWEVPLVCIDPLLIAPQAVVTQAGRNNAATTSSAVAGSTWRGLFRARSEFILRSCGVSACASTDEPTCGVCPTCELFGWTPGPGQPPDRTGAQGLIRFRDSAVSGDTLTYTHAPIDRFTGGAAEGKLFERKSWAPGAVMTLVVEQISPRRPIPDWGPELLGLVLRDLHDGLIGVGNSSTRGYGTIAMREPDHLPEIAAGWLTHVPRPPARPVAEGATR